MVCIEWWTFEIGTFLAGLSVPGELAPSLGSHSSEASQKWKLLCGPRRGLQFRHGPAASRQLSAVSACAGGALTWLCPLVFCEQGKGAFWDGMTISPA